jgi:hypothetical protein
MEIHCFLREFYQFERYLFQRQNLLRIHASVAACRLSLVWERF